MGMEKLTFDSPQDVAVVTLPREALSQEVVAMLVNSWETLWTEKGLLVPIIVIVPQGYKFDAISCAKLLSDDPPGLVAPPLRLSS